MIENDVDDEVSQGVYIQKGGKDSGQPVLLLGGCLCVMSQRSDCEDKKTRRRKTMEVEMMMMERRRRFMKTG